MKKRCVWAGTDPIYTKYHDTEWGVPLHDDQKLFEFLILDGAQAGLSWITILKKRCNYRDAFDGFNPAKVARYDSRKIKQLLLNKGIIRNRLKIEAATQNARAFLDIQNEFGSFYNYLWNFVEGKQIINRVEKLEDVPAKTELSDAISKDMKKRGFKFIGTTIIYAYLQAVGVVDDHLKGCMANE